MRKPSRFMPPAPRRRAGFLACVVLAAMAHALWYSLWQRPVWTLAALLVLATGAAISRKSERARLMGVAARRSPGGGICAFSRSFDLHQVDPWIVRAVYEEVARYFKGLGVVMQINADDNLIKNLGIDPEDLDMDIALDIAARTGRSLAGYKTNPYFADTDTVRGLVMFFNAQPRAV